MRILAAGERRNEGDAGCSGVEIQDSVYGRQRQFRYQLGIFAPGLVSESPAVLQREFGRKLLLLCSGRFVSPWMSLPEGDFAQALG